jgi:hypothetical protein
VGLSWKAETVFGPRGCRVERQRASWPGRRDSKRGQRERRTVASRPDFGRPRSRHAPVARDGRAEGCAVRAQRVTGGPGGARCKPRPGSSTRWGVGTVLVAVCISTLPAWRTALFVRLISHQLAVLFSQNHQQPVSSNFLLEQTSTSHQPNEQTVPSLAVGGKRTGCSKQYVEVDPKTTTFITQIRKIDRDSVNEWEACDLHP